MGGDAGNQDLHGYCKPVLSTMCLDMILLEAGLLGALKGRQPKRAHPGEAAALVQEVEDAQRLLLNQVQHVLVVHKGDVGPVDGLALVLRLLKQWAACMVPCTACPPAC